MTDKLVQLFAGRDTGNCLASLLVVARAFAGVASVRLPFESYSSETNTTAWHYDAAEAATNGECGRSRRRPMRSRICVPQKSTFGTNPVRDILPLGATDLRFKRGQNEVSQRGNRGSDPRWSA